MTKTLLSVERLGISISGLSLTQNITVAIAAGERAGIVGESGCGKTSIAELLDIALPPASSTARLPAPLPRRPAASSVRGARGHSRHAKPVFRQPTGPGLVISPTVNC